MGHLNWSGVAQSHHHHVFRHRVRAADIECCLHSTPTSLLTVVGFFCSDSFRFSAESMKCSDRSINFSSSSFHSFDFVSEFLSHHSNIRSLCAIEWVCWACYISSRLWSRFSVPTLYWLFSFVILLTHKKSKEKSGRRKVDLWEFPNFSYCCCCGNVEVLAFGNNNVRIMLLAVIGFGIVASSPTSLLIISDFSRTFSIIAWLCNTFHQMRIQFELPSNSFHLSQALVKVLEGNRHRRRQESGNKNARISRKSFISCRKDFKSNFDIKGGSREWKSFECVKLVMSSPAHRGWCRWA